MNQVLVPSPSAQPVTSTIEPSAFQPEGIPQYSVMSRAEPTLAGSAVEKFFQALPDIAPNKKPVTGFLVSLVFGLIGLAVYVRSWFDFLLFIAVIGIIVVAPPSVPDWVLWLLWGVWGFLRVKYSRVRPRNLSSPCNPPRQTVLNNSVEPVIVS